MIKHTILVVTALLALGASAQARQHKATQPICDNIDIMRPCAYNPNFLSGVKEIKVKMQRVASRSYEDPRNNRRTSKRKYHQKTLPNPIQTVTKVVESAVQIAAQFLPHPTGCPRALFCGCGAAQEVGKSNDRSLWVASSWYKFPRSEPAANTVAVRSYHVFVLKQHVNGSNWLVADYNSGGRLSRLHVRNISGWTIVNPNV